MNKPSFEQFLKESLEQTKEVSPKRDLWPGIERALVSHNEHAKKVSYWPKLTGVAACMVAGLLAWQVVIKQPQQNTMVDISAFFEQQKQSLLVQYEAQPALTSDWQAQLKELESAEQAVKSALQNDPENAALLKMLAQVYQQQLDLINKVHEPRWQQI
ncbi:hypothetical protein PSECIP111951_02688 [Pseudoalteromonas holothuriae]|uniref:Uncharacterized protein n=1 Tax=Pseudoalteromonas holothuriae TaxID=2963714 RepID=A0A9W4QVE6_9GAMM|nr:MULTISPECIES: hypothetical protein [unclassified Pseudoalteromonas]CAH9054889.1 hypothetical protein PSECIP111854_01466 [Pseudoalteromonas sp. CIP111854]CAH9062432.1 hypothetical protein PSECIP111951_02688 [Pseudoalteromonas sp. CIP111951]